MRTNCTCHFCGEPLWRKPAVLKINDGIAYCDRACQSAQKAIDLASPHAPNTTCSYCGKAVFRFPRDLRRTEKSYCGKLCYDLAQKTSKPNCVCETCGIVFYRAPGHHNRGEHNYCSLPCKNDGWRHKPNRVCKTCEKPIYRRPKLNGENVYCSMECRAIGVYKLLNNGINGLERDFQEDFPELLFVGDGSYWVSDEIGKMNPDFILPSTNKCVELFGDFWHKGEDPRIRIERLANSGLRAIVIWEGDYRKNHEITLEAMYQFINY